MVRSPRNIVRQLLKNMSRALTVRRGTCTPERASQGTEDCEHTKRAPRGPSLWWPQVGTRCCDLPWRNGWTTCGTCRPWSSVSTKATSHGRGGRLDGSQGTRPDWNKTKACVKRSRAAWFCLPTRHLQWQNSVLGGPVSGGGVGKGPTGLQSVGETFLATNVLIAEL